MNKLINPSLPNSEAPLLDVETNRNSICIKAHNYIFKQELVILNNIYY